MQIGQDQRGFRVAAAMLVVALLTAGCAATSTEGRSNPSGYRSSDEQQSETCDGVPAPTPGSLQLLDKSAEVVGAEMCTDSSFYVPGQGFWKFTEVHVLPAARLPALVSGLTQPDGSADPPAACTASLMLVPGFVLTLADGSRIRPGIPGDGCHAKGDSLAAFDLKPAIRATKVTRTTQIMTDLEATSNCGTEAKGPAIWLDAGGKGGGRPVLPGAGSVSICRYHATGNGEGSLSAVGIVPVATLNSVWPGAAALSAAPPAGCVPSADPMKSSVDWLMFLPTPKPPYRSDNSGGSPIALLELADCLRLVDPQKGLAGYTSGSVTAALAALATKLNR